MINRPKVFVSRVIAGEAQDQLRAQCDVEVWPHQELPCPSPILAEQLAQVDGALIMGQDPVPAQLLPGQPGRRPRLRILANMAVGFDNIEVGAATARGIMVTNTPGVLTETTADLAWALLLAAARRLGEGERIVRSGRWQSWAPNFMVGQDVYGATLGIVGLGRIGRAVAARARGFNMQILYYGRNQQPEVERQLGAEYCSLEALLGKSDFVVITVPLTADTRGLIGKRELGLMKPTAVLVNVARGPVVDQAALIEALQKQTIWAAGLDVYEEEPLPSSSPLTQLENVVLLPHIGSATVATRTKMAVTAAENLLAGLQGQRPANLVNPEVLALATGPAVPDNHRWCG